MPFLHTAAACMDRSLLVALPRVSVRIAFRHVSEFMANFLSSWSSSSAASSATPTARRWTYDVFLCFHGKDTRKRFVGHLYAALDQAGLRTFKDDKKLPKGNPIPLELKKAIQESMIHVVILSKNFANSTWCLDEVAEIIRCQKNKASTTAGQKVLPVFYRLDPSDVREQKGTFHAAFKRHELKYKNGHNREKVKRWREALKTTANISGWDVSKTACGCEAECIKQIVQNIVNYMEASGH